MPSCSRCRTTAAHGITEIDPKIHDHRFRRRRLDWLSLDQLGDLSRPCRDFLLDLKDRRAKLRGVNSLRGTHWCRDSGIVRLLATEPRSVRTAGLRQAFA